MKNKVQLYHDFIDFLLQKNIMLQGKKLLLAVSGGMDSVCLSHLCNKAGFEFAIAHANFSLRGKESDRDEKCTESLAEQLGVKFYSRKFETKKIAQELKLSIQETARKLRYEWFDELILENGFHYILTAHHADDNIETVLMNIFRGTGMEGLTGIPVKRDKIIRPLLFAKRKQIKDYVKKHELDYVEDSSNDDKKYTRNFFRKELIPSIKHVFPEVDENLQSNISRWTDATLLYRKAVEREIRRLSEIKGNTVHIPVLKLKLTPSFHTIIYEITKSFGFTSGQVDEICALLDSQTGRYVDSHTHRVLRNRNWLIITPLHGRESAHIVIEDAADIINFSQGTLKFSSLNKKVDINVGRNIALIDQDEIAFPLVLRQWKTGDYFYPLGMRKKKKIARFLIDQKVSGHEKENVWVLESDKRIVWVVNHRIDDRFKIAESSSNILKIEFHQNS